MIKSLSVFTICLFGSTLFAQTFDPQPEWFRKQREMPLVSISTTQNIYVSSYGAMINDGQDDLAAIQQAIDAAESASSPVRLVFENGTYDLMPTSGDYSLKVDNADNIVIDGQGAKILVHNARIGFMEVFSCTNVIVQDLKIDWAELPFTQGVVTEVTSNYEFILAIDPGFPLPTDSQFGNAGERWGVLKDADGSGKVKTGAPNLYSHNTVTHISDNIYKYLLHNTTGEVSVGDYYIDIARTNERTVFKTTYSKNVTYLRDTVYASPSATFNGFNNYEWNIINCGIVPKTGRVHSSNADPIHMTGDFFGPWVQGCHSEAFTDDIANLKHAGRAILSVVNPNTLQILYHVNQGEEIALFNPRDGILLGVRTITNVVNKGNNIYEITLNGEHGVTLTGDERFSDRGYLTSRSNESFIFRNNTFKNSRGWGLLIQAKYGEIKGNRFENISSGAIKLANVPDWGEGFVASDILITDNIIINCGLDKEFLEDPNRGAVVTKVRQLKSPCTAGMPWCGEINATWQGLENIAITNNYIEYNKTGLFLESINGLTLSGNTLLHNSNDPYSGSANDEYINNCTFANVSNVTGVNVDPTSISLDATQTAQLTATVIPADATDTSVEWSSNNASVATVDVNGLITAVADGTAIIAVTTNDGSFTANCAVIVGTSNVGITGVGISPVSVALEPAETSQLTATVTPANATDPSVVWISDNTLVATVDVNGLVTAVADGTATITVTTNDGSFTATSAITVSTRVNDVSINPTSVSLEAAETAQLTATVIPANATDPSVVWISDDTSVAIVDANGLLTAVAEGTATITVTTKDGSFTAISTVTVVSILGQLSPIDEKNWSIYPNPADDFIWIEGPNIQQTIVRIILYDLSGQKIIENEVNPDQSQYKIDVQGLARGIHLLDIYTSDQIIRRKVVIQ